MVLVALVLATGTIFERYRGADWVGANFYGSWWFTLLMALVAIAAIAAILSGKMWRTPSMLLLLASVPVILLGGGLTTWTGQHGSMTLAPGETLSEYSSGDQTYSLPFTLTLESFDVIYYPGTRTPMDFVSRINADGERFDISMNHIYRRDNYRFYQEDYDPDGHSTLSVSHDPWGIAVTYCGYALLLLGMLLLIVSPNGPFRRLLRSAAVAALLLIPLSATAAPQTLPKATADKMGEMYILYKGRICPLQTFAKDFTTKLTGKATYEGLTSEQFLSGFLFYYDDWSNFQIKKEKRKKEGENLIQMVISGKGLKLFPVADSAGSVRWYAQNDELPPTVTDDEYLFIRKQQSYCQELVLAADYNQLENVFSKTRLFQQQRAADVLPSTARLKAERLYNALTTGRWLAMLNITLGLLLFAYALWTVGRRRPMPRGVRLFLVVYLLLLTAFLLLIFILRWVAGGHIPMAGGFDSMNLMAIAIGLLGLLLGLLHAMALPAAMLTMGFCLLVAMMSGSNPPVTNLMPVLSSPLLCLHVAVIMMSYALFFFVMMIGIAGLATGHQAELSERFHRLGIILLYPAEFLLALGIIIGALWANISWGNYWTWDPKEVWALITFIVYAFPLHSSLKVGTNPRAFFLYSTFAFLSVIITYFGVNFILGGIHAYN